LKHYPLGDNGNISSAMDGVDVAPSRPWTAEEMMAAEPLPEPEISHADMNKAASVDNPVQGSTGPAGFIPSGLPMESAGHD
jgi:hypothetical protein